MPRGPRLDAPNSLHHVTARGIEGRDIFADDQDRRKLIEILTRVVPARELGCLVWAFMSNHLHLLLCTGSRPLSDGIHRILSAYARYFNSRHDRSGYLFQGRFHSSLIQDDSYLLTAIRYVLRNPIEGGVVSSVDALERYDWTAYPALMGMRPASFESLDFTLALFGTSKRGARRALRGFLSTAEETRPLSDCRLDVLGDEAFERRVLRERRRTDDPRLEKLIDSVCEGLGVDRAAVAAGRRSAANAATRAAIAHLARDLGISLRQLAPRLGVSRSALSRSLHRGARVVEERKLGPR